MNFFDKNLLPYQGEAYYEPDFFISPDSDRFYQELLTEIQWKQEPIQMFGKQVMQPRLTAFYGDAGIGYRYSGITMQPQPWIPCLSEIKQQIEKQANTTFTSVLLNLYRHQKDSMGWHRDNEKELGEDPAIGSVSFGATRTFQLRHYQTKSGTISLALTHGSFLLMQGATQHYWEHQIPKTTKEAGTRINLTFRNIKTT